MEMVGGYVAGIEAIDGLKMHAKPDLTIINFGSDEVDIFRVAEVMVESEWVPGMTQRPKGLNAMLSMLHAPAREDYLADLQKLLRRHACLTRNRLFPRHIETRPIRPLVDMCGAR